MLITGSPVELMKRISGERIYDRYNYEVFHFIAKYTLNIVLLMLTVLAVFFLSKIVGFKVAYLVGLLLTLDTFFLGNARLLHMDVLLSLLTANALFCIFLALKQKTYRFFMLGSAFLSLALWTKNVSLVSISFVFLVLGVLFLLKKLSFRTTLVYGFTVLLGVVVIGYLILPALWVDPAKVVRRIYTNSTRVVEEGHEEKFFGKITNNPGPFYYPIVFGYKLTPVILILFLVGVGWLLTDLVKKLIKKDYTFSDSKRLFLYYLLAYFCIYFVSVEIAEKKIDRYLLPLFPIIYVVSSFYFFDILRFFSKKSVKFLYSFALLVTIGVPLYTYFPYYFVYNSPLLGGPVKAEKVIGQKSFGIGIFEVRDFLLENYGFVPVGFVDRKAMSAIYPSSMVWDARVSGPQHYTVLVLDSDEVAPQSKDKFVYDKTIKIAGINFWNFYVKKVQ